MEEKHRKILQTCNFFLIKNIFNVENICDYLVQHEILTPGMVDKIMVRYSK